MNSITLLTTSEVAVARGGLFGPANVNEAMIRCYQKSKLGAIDVGMWACMISALPAVNSTHPGTVTDGTVYISAAMFFATLSATFAMIVLPLQLCCGCGPLFGALRKDK